MIKRILSLKSLTRPLLACQERGRRLADRLSPPGSDNLLPSLPVGDELERFRNPGQAQVSWQNKQTQWWYFTGHLENEGGRKLGFELVFFERQTQRDYLGILPLRAIVPRFFVAHCAVSDPGHPNPARRFRYWQRGGLWDRRPASASDQRFQVEVGGWSAAQDENGVIRLQAAWEDGDMHLDLKPAKPLVFHGDRGFSPKNTDGSVSSFYCSYTRLDAGGEIKIDNELMRVRGHAWMDIEKMTSRNEMLNSGWDWCSLQLDSGEDLMFYFIRRPAKGEIYSCGTWVTRDGQSVFLHQGDILLEDLEYWTSPRTEGKYPVRRRASIRSLCLDIEIRPLLEFCELDTMRTSFNSYWEGPVTVEGRLGKKSGHGRGYMELVGYDRRGTAELCQLLFADGTIGK